MSGEFAAIDHFTAPFASEAPGLLLGPGDDAALLRPAAGLALAATTDTLRDGVHFGPLFRNHEIGHKALAINLSDLAAMGARPRWFLAALELPPGTSPARLAGIARGMAALAAHMDVALAGGNLSQGERLAITITALGDVDPATSLRRDRLRVGDWVAVTGSLGGAAFGLSQLCAGSRRGAERQLRPEPRVSAGRAALGLARAAIDVSDGLAQDLSHLAARSKVDVELELGALPIDPRLAGHPRARQWALSGGEDYELVLGGPPRHWLALKRSLSRLGVPLTRVGQAVKSKREPGLLWTVDDKGTAPVRLPALGFQHSW